MGDNLLKDIEDYLKSYVVLPNEAEYTVLAAYTIHTWAMEATNTTPYLYIYSPDPGSGKSTLLEVLSSISNSPAMTANITAPTLMNLIHQEECTLFFDEVDMVFASNNSNNKQIQGVLNAGYRRGNPGYRVQGEGVRKINVFGPKVLAGINNGALPNTLVDRALPVQLRRKRADQKVKPFFITEIDDADPILDAIEEWVDAHIDNLKDYRTPDHVGWSPRLIEIGAPLLAIAKEFGVEEEVSATIYSMVETYKRDVATQDKSVEFLRTIATLFSLIGRNRVFTEEVLEFMDKPNNVKAQKELAEMAKAHGVEAHNVRVGNKRRKGYELLDWAAALDYAGFMRPDGTIKEETL